MSFRTTSDTSDITSDRRLAELSVLHRLSSSVVSVHRTSEMFSIVSLQNCAFEPLKLTKLLPDLNERGASDYLRSKAVTPMQFKTLANTPAAS